MIDGKILGQKEIYIVEWDDIMSILENSASTTASGPSTGESESNSISEQSQNLFNYILYPIIVAYNAGKIVLLRKASYKYFFLISCPSINTIETQSYSFIFVRYENIFLNKKNCLYISNEDSGLIESPRCEITCKEEEIQSSQIETFTIATTRWHHDSTAKVYYYTPTFDDFMILSYSANSLVWYNTDLNRFESSTNVSATVSCFLFGSTTTTNIWNFF